MPFPIAVEQYIFFIVGIELPSKVLPKGKVPRQIEVCCCTAALLILILARDVPLEYYCFLVKLNCKAITMYFGITKCDRICEKGPYPANINFEL